MIAKFLTLAAIISFIIVSTSCGEKNPTPEKNETVGSDKATEEFVLAEKKDEPLDPKNLVKALPDIPGSEKFPENTGYQDWEGYKCTLASTEYKFPNKGYYSVHIADYGSKEKIPDKDKGYIEKLPSKIGMNSERIDDDVTEGFMLWNEYTGYGEIKALKHGRFVVAIEAQALPEGAPDPLKVLNSMRFEDALIASE